jgi:hypothetical protein
LPITIYFQPAQSKNGQFNLMSIFGHSQNRCLFMKYQPAMYALERLHAELGGKIIDNKREAKRQAQSMKHVEAVLKMLEPGYSVRGISVRRRRTSALRERRAPFLTGEPAERSGQASVNEAWRTPA